MKIKKLSQEKPAMPEEKPAIPEEKPAPQFPPTTYEDVTGLTDVELERNDFIHNEIFDLINRLNPKGTEVEWDIGIIAEIADDIEDYLVKKGICTAMEFSPYRES